MNRAMYVIRQCIGLIKKKQKKKNKDSATEMKGLKDVLKESEVEYGNFCIVIFAG